MKRILYTAVLLLVCMIGFAAYSQAEVQTVPNARMMDIADDGSTIFFRTEAGEIYGYTMGDETPTLLETGFPNTEYGGLFVADHNLYTIKKDERKFIRIIARNTSSSFHDMQIENFEERTKATDIWTPFCMKNTSHGLFWMMNVDYSDEALLCKYDFSSKELSCRTIDSLHSFCVRDDGTLLIVQLGMDGRILSSYDWEDQKLTNSTVLPQGANGFVLSGEDLLFNASGEVMVWKADMSVETIMRMPIPNDSRINSVLINGDTLTAAFSSQLALGSLEQASAGTSTLLVLNDNATTTGYTEFAQSFPEVEVQFSQLDEYPDTIELAQKLLTGELTYDVFKINSSDFDLETLAAKGYLEDLTGNAALFEAVSQMEPQITKAAFYDERLYAIPCSIAGNFITYYADNFALAGVDESGIPHDYQAFYDFIAEWDGGNPADAGDEFSLFSVEHGEVFSLFLKELLKANIACCASEERDISFDSMPFRNLLQKCKEAALVVEEEDVVGYLMFEMGSTNIIDRHLLALSFEAATDPVVAVEMDFYIINPMSTNKALAQSYIESCVAAYTQQQRLQLYPQYTEPIISQNYADYIDSWEVEKEELETRLTSVTDDAESTAIQDQLNMHMENREALAPEKYDISPEDIAFYKTEITPYLFVPNASMMNVTVHDQFAFESAIMQYIGSHTPDEQFILEMDKVCQMIQLENQ